MGRGFVHASAFAILPLPVQIVDDGARIDFQGRIAEHARDPAVVQEVPRSIGRSLEEPAVDHPSSQRDVIDWRVNGLEPLAERVVDLPLPVGSSSVQLAGGNGEDAIQVVRMSREPLEASGTEQSAQQPLEIFPGIHFAKAFRHHATSKRRERGARKTRTAASRRYAAEPHSDPSQATRTRYAT